MQRLRSTYDVVVVGAGPAGVAAAAGYGRGGHSVLLLEANPKASWRFAGEWVHPAGAAVLEELGLYPGGPTASHSPCRGFAVFPDDTSEPVKLDYVNASLGFSCEHGQMVQALRDGVRDISCVDYVPNARVTGVTGHRVTFRDARGDVDIRAERVVGADGRSSTVRKSIGGPSDADLVSHMAGVEIYDADLPFEGYGHVLLGGPGPILLYRIAPDRLRACLDLPADLPTVRRDARYLWDAFGPRFPAPLRPAFKRALENERVAWACNRFLPRQFYGRDHVALVGDAVGFYHPLTASGITIGLKDTQALLATDTVADYRAHREPKSYVPELLANALYQVFTRTDASAASIRRAVFDTWRDNPVERERTMNILEGDAVNMAEFGGAFVRVAMRAVKDRVRAGGVGDLAGFMEWSQWPAATVVPSFVRQRIREKSTNTHPMRGLNIAPPHPTHPAVCEQRSTIEVDVDELLARVVESSESSGARGRARALRQAASSLVDSSADEAKEATELAQRVRASLGDLASAADRATQRDIAMALAQVRQHHPGLVARSMNDALTRLAAELRQAQSDAGRFGSVRETALSMEALVACGAATFDPALRRAIQFFAATEAPDGGWGKDTAVVLRALLECHAPIWESIERGFRSLEAAPALDEVAGEALHLFRDRRMQRVTPPKARRGGAPTEEDWRFCEKALLAVSRTFARPIQMLPGDLHRAVTCGYLLCRIADTIEDNAHLSTADRDARYTSFLAAIEEPADGPNVQLFERQWSNVPGRASELELAQHLSAVMRVFRALPSGMQQKTIRWVAEMTRGMQLYSHRLPGPDGIMALYTVEDLERYCYFVAGTVGHMLTDLFVEELGHVGSDVEYALRKDAECFGIGLQLVNILKDVTDDRERDVSFIPRTSCHEQGLEVRELTEPSHRAAAHAAVASLFDRAQSNLDRALEYTLAIPKEAGAVRLFCLLPLWMAVRTLVHARGHDAMFVAGAPVKITRDEVESLIAQCVANAANDEALRLGYDALWRTPRASPESRASVN